MAAKVSSATAATELIPQCLVGGLPQQLEAPSLTASLSTTVKVSYPDGQVPALDMATLQEMGEFGDIARCDSSMASMLGCLLVTYFDVRCAQRLLLEKPNRAEPFPPAAHDYRSVRINLASFADQGGHVSGFGMFGEVAHLSINLGDAIVEYYDMRAAQCLVAASSGSGTPIPQTVPPWQMGVLGGGMGGMPGPCGDLTTPGLAGLVGQLAAAAGGIESLLAAATATGTTSNLAPLAEPGRRAAAAAAAAAAMPGLPAETMDAGVYTRGGVAKITPKSGGTYMSVSALRTHGGIGSNRAVSNAATAIYGGGGKSAGAAGQRGQGGSGSNGTHSHNSQNGQSSGDGSHGGDTGSSSKAAGERGNRPVRTKVTTRDFSKYDVDPERIMSGGDGRTTVMVRNLTGMHARKDFMNFLEQCGLAEKYLFFYMPCKEHRNVPSGFAFVNFISPEDVLKLYVMVKSGFWREVSSDAQSRALAMSYARFQGQEELMKHFSSSAVLHEEDPGKRPIFRYKGGPLQVFGVDRGAAAATGHGARHAQRATAKKYAVPMNTAPAKVNTESLAAAGDAKLQSALSSGAREIANIIASAGMTPSLPSVTDLGSVGLQSPPIPAPGLAEPVKARQAAVVAVDADAAMRKCAEGDQTVSEAEHSYVPDGKSDEGLGA